MQPTLHGACDTPEIVQGRAACLCNLRCTSTLVVPRCGPDSTNPRHVAGRALGLRGGARRRVPRRTHRRDAGQNRPTSGHARNRSWNLPSRRRRQAAPSGASRRPVRARHRPPSCRTSMGCSMAVVTFSLVSTSMTGPEATACRAICAARRQVSPRVPRCSRAGTGWNARDGPEAGGGLVPTPSRGRVSRCARCSARVPGSWTASGPGSGRSPTRCRARLPRRRWRSPCRRSCRGRRSGGLLCRAAW
jgi:hypothetical protein